MLLPAAAAVKNSNCYGFWLCITDHMAEASDYLMMFKRWWQQEREREHLPPPSCNPLTLLRRILYLTQVGRMSIA